MRASYISPEEGRTADNYKMLCEKWREIFLAMDHRELAERFGLERDDQNLYITFYHQRYALNRETGMIFREEDPEWEPGFHTVMCIYHLFYYSREYAKIRGEFVPFRQVKRAAPFDAAFQRTTLKPLAKAFEGCRKELEKACLALGGKKLPQGDVGYQIEAFDCMPLQLLFWDGDDEFEAQANILFDADITDFIHEETVVSVAAELFRRLVEEAELQEARQPYQL